MEHHPARPSQRDRHRRRLTRTPAVTAFRCCYAFSPRLPRLVRASFSPLLSQLPAPAAHQRRINDTSTTIQRRFNDASTTLQRHFNDTSSTLRRHFD
jgi:hypothetical protein